MRLWIVAVGRMKAGPEQDLAARYLDRLRKTGAPLGLEWGGVLEFAEARQATVPERKRDEAARIEAALPAGAAFMVLDETGRMPSSPEFAGEIARLRDEGLRDLALVIGGPDGLLPELRARAQTAVAFGRLTLPHQIVRILVAEQLYRATTILAGHPYHRS
ncbi:23S rRNA (pseudouridine(1915)-N(3))-methyltransferase RlmH [Aureimonas flava]|uniref:Ribosomal RNA large subunit methyltransferase H n=1 Tax=Aureimonas flava TaxID=2320271 RepID=A0A3A1WJ75_9HYPH|nr:23S rRNA (pseudouridine(1915)-N(3))-methyltransferase RlmH [Aureimonas flava]RIY01044.1 23S rRNA (pseudouridine(1915)-N(3))-methyltransferase RlmH [Aureimonas flava]